MNFTLSMLYGVVSSLYGCILSASFCDVFPSQKKRRIFVSGITVLILIQCALYFVGSVALVRKLYPVLIHLMLYILLRILTGKRMWPIICILTAYSCCQMRRWLALLIVAMVPAGTVSQTVAEVLLTLPMLCFILWKISPIVRQLSVCSLAQQCQLAIFPALSYLFDYATRVYTKLLYNGSTIAVEFMPFVCCIAYFSFLIYNVLTEYKKRRMEQTQKYLRIQLRQSVHEIYALRESQELAKRYRHDLRHHLQYVLTCIENGKPEEAKGYISGIFREVEAQKVERYCENEEVNLILSAFSGRALKEGIKVDMDCVLSGNIAVSNSDLCVLLSNALENALYACRETMAEMADSKIALEMFERNGKIFLQISNPYIGEVAFENGIPVNHSPGHGIGVQSICAIVEKYQGVCDFKASDGLFVLRISI